MTLSDLASIGSFVSGVAVVITLVMLLLQMRQTDRNQRAAMQLGRATRGTDVLTRLIDPEVARIARKAWTSCEPLAVLTCLSGCSTRPRRFSTGKILFCSIARAFWTRPAWNRRKLSFEGTWRTRRCRQYGNLTGRRGGRSSRNISTGLSRKCR